jgi:hypothetical protein
LFRRNPKKIRLNILLIEQYALQKESLDWNLAINRLMERKDEKCDFLENFGLFEGDLTGSEEGSDSESEEEAGEEDGKAEGKGEGGGGGRIIDFFPNLHRWKVGQTPPVRTERRIDLKRRTEKARAEDVSKELAEILSMREDSNLNKNFYTKKFLKFEILANFR